LTVVRRHAMRFKATCSFPWLLGFCLVLAPRSAGEESVHTVDKKGVQFKGHLGPEKPREVYRVKLEQGGTYVVDMTSTDAKALDPFLRLLDASGNVLVEDDDGGGGLNARILFVSPRAATFQIVAGSFEDKGAGPFTLKIRRDDSKEGQALERMVQELRRQGKYAEAGMPPEPSSRFNAAFKERSTGRQSMPRGSCGPWRKWLLYPPMVRPR
jgi:hypothetical protein